MARLHLGYFDSKGVNHPTPERATIADLTALLGVMKNGPGTILAKREAIERLFAEHDAMLDHQQSDVANLDDARRQKGRG